MSSYNLHYTCINSPPSERHINERCQLINHMDTPGYAPYAHSRCAGSSECHSIADSESTKA